MGIKNLGGINMKIGVDAGCLGITDKRLKVGVYQVVKNLLIELGKIDSTNEYLLYSFAPIEKSLLKEFGPQMRNIVVTPARGWLKIWLPLRLLFDRPHIFLALNQSMPFQLAPSYKTLGIFYDIAFEKMPALYEYAASVIKHSSNSRYLAKNANGLIAISSQTKQDIVGIYQVDPKKITVAYPGIPLLKQEKEISIKEKNYFLFVGAFKKSKNIPRLLKAFADFKKHNRGDYLLLLVGGDKWLDPEIQMSLSTLPNSIQEKIHFMGFVEDIKLFSLYQHAIAFVSPSMYEGFGLPFAEAMRIGCPVIGSTAGSLPEIVGNAGLLVNPTSISELALAMEKVIHNDVRKDLIAKGRKKVKAYSWKSFAKEVYSAIQRLS